MKIYFAILGMVMVSSVSYADKVADISKPFNKGECAISYQNSKGRSEFKVVKKSEISELQKTLPKKQEAAVCEDNLKAAFKIVSDKCELFCNPN